LKRTIGHNHVLQSKFRLHTTHATSKGSQHEECLMAARLQLLANDCTQVIFKPHTVHLHGAWLPEVL
jgi:hypothetical protein